MIDAAIKVSEIVHNQNMKLCYNDNNIYEFIQTEARNNLKSLNEIIMTDKSARYALVFKDKNSAKKLKNQVKKFFKKLLTLFMRQEVYQIIIQDILKSSFSVHKMMFQNLSS